jgi:hypothetical protein
MAPGDCPGTCLPHRSGHDIAARAFSPLEGPWHGSLSNYSLRRPAPPLDALDHTLLPHQAVVVVVDDDVVVAEVVDVEVFLGKVGTLREYQGAHLCW